MAKPFSETTRSLSADGFKGAYSMLALVVLFALAWSWWFVNGRVATWEITQNAVLEVNGKVYGVDAPLGAKVFQQFLEVDKRVAKGDILLVLESGRLSLQLAEEEAQLQSYQAQLSAARAQGEANMAALRQSLEENLSQVAKTEAELETAQKNSITRRDIANRYKRLAAEKMVSEIEYLDAQNKWEAAQGAETALKLSLKFFRSQQSTATHNWEVSKAEIAERITQLEGDWDKSRRTIERLRLEISERTILAPVSGTLGEVAALQPGSYVASGFRLCTIIPAGETRVLAHFNPGVALGRIHVGQSARVHLKGFPWTQYGDLTALVKRVGGEPRAGKVQVELELQGKTPAGIPLQHGMPGIVEVRIGQFSPMELIMRAVGMRLQAGGEDAQ